MPFIDTVQEELVLKISSVASNPAGTSELEGDKNIKLVIVEWEDSNFLHGWRDKRDVLERQQISSYCVSAGILLKQDKKEIRLAQSISGENVADIISIPQLAIKRIRQLQVRR